MPTHGMDERLLAVLKEHNPWLVEPARQGVLLADGLPSPFVPRAATLEMPRGRVELVVGPRQAGKTTWIRHEMSRRSEPLLVLHAEEPRIRELCESPAEALRALAGVLAPSTVVLVEEVQRLRDASLFLKGVVDLQPRRRIVATGSSSFALRARTRESLAGRARRTLLLTFSLEELAAVLPPRAPALADDERRGLWERLAVRGGYPRVWFAEDPAPELHHLVEAFVLRDASDLHTIERPKAFRRILELAAADVGNLANITAWASTAGISRDTTMRYLDIAVEAHLLRLVPPFAGGKRAELTGAPKVAFLDNGLRNALFGGFAPLDRRADRGALWENAVFGELVRRTRLLDRIHHWRSKNGAEVDFVLLRHDGRIAGVEVKAADLRAPVLSRSARSFLAAYRPHRMGVVNASLRQDLEVEGVPVLFRRPWELGDLLAED